MANERITLTELEATLLRRKDDKHAEHVTSLKDAHGVMFMCPKCYRENDGPAGTHWVVCWFVGVPSYVTPKGRWNPKGKTVEDLTFVGPGATSVALRSACAWHGFIEEGYARDCE